MRRGMARADCFESKRSRYCDRTRYGMILGQSIALTGILLKHLTADIAMMKPRTASKINPINLLMILSFCVRMSLSTGSCSTRDCDATTGSYCTKVLK